MEVDPGQNTIGPGKAHDERFNKSEQAFDQLDRAGACFSETGKDKSRMWREVGTILA